MTLTDPDELLIVVNAVPVAESAVRRRVSRWLTALAWPAAESDDILLAVNEAVANVTDHAYLPDRPGTATLHAWPVADPRADLRWIVITVIDRGRWGAHHPENRARSLRGRGLDMMEACSAELHVQPSAAGTTVIMVSRAVPISAAPFEIDDIEPVEPPTRV